MEREVLDSAAVGKAVAVSENLGDGSKRAVLKVTGASKRFGHTQALAGAEMEVLPGEVHGLVGANGAGKSTLVKAVSGALQLDEGQIRIGGFEGSGVTPREAQEHGLSTIYQDNSLVPTLDQEENLLLGREVVRAGLFLNDRSQRSKIKETLARVGLSFRPGVSVGSMSPAEQQLLEIAKALFRDARVVLMDEPTAALGNVDRERLFSVMRSLRDDGVGIVYISHNLGEVLGICDRVTVMRDGTTVGTASASDISEDGLMKMMIGRDLKRTTADPREIGGLALRVDGLGQENRLSDISFELRCGEILGITGLVGSGRSRLARTIFGAEGFDRGSIELFGDEYKAGSPSDAIKRGVGLVPQDRKLEALEMGMSVQDNITLPLVPSYPGGVIKSGTERNQARKWVRHLGIKTPSSGTIVSSLSGGNQQKVAVARWLYAGARVMIFDEPGQAVDVGAKQEIFAAIRDLAATGCAVIVISEEIEELQQMVNRLLVMKGGRITGHLQAEEIEEEKVISMAMGVNGSKSRGEGSDY